MTWPLTVNWLFLLTFNYRYKLLLHSTRVEKTQNSHNKYCNLCHRHKVSMLIYRPDSLRRSDLCSLDWAYSHTCRRCSHQGHYTASETKIHMHTELVITLNTNTISVTSCQYDISSPQQYTSFTVDNTTRSVQRQTQISVSRVHDSELSQLLHSGRGSWISGMVEQYSST